MIKYFKWFTIFLVLFVLIIFWIAEERKFYCLSEGKCVTVWKNIGGRCYIIPGKYYGVFVPVKNYIQTSNVNNITIYWNTYFQDKIILRCDNDCEIKNNPNDSMIIKFDKQIKKILYEPKTIQFDDLANDTEMIAIFIKENFALDKKGKKL